MSEKEQTLKAAYNAYVDALVDFCAEIAPVYSVQCAPGPNPAVQYLLDQNNHNVFPDTLAVSKVRACGDPVALQNLLNRKVL